MAPPKVPQRTSQGYTLITREDALSHPRTTSPARAPHNNISPLNSPVRLCRHRGFVKLLCAELFFLKLFRKIIASLLVVLIGTHKHGSSYPAESSH